MAASSETGINNFLAMDSHYLLLTTWAETGLVGLVLLVAVHVLLARALWRRHRLGSVAATGALLSHVGFHVLSLVHFLPFHSCVHLSFALAWGLGLCAGSEVLQEQVVPHDPHPSPLPGGEGAFSSTRR